MALTLKTDGKGIIMKKLLFLLLIVNFAFAGKTVTDTIYSLNRDSIVIRDNASIHGTLKASGGFLGIADSSLGSSRLGGLDKSAFSLAAHAQAISTITGLQDSITSKINGTGTAGVIPLFDGSKTIGNSILSQYAWEDQGVNYTDIMLGNYADPTKRFYCFGRMQVEEKSIFWDDLTVGGNLACDTLKSGILRVLGPNTTYYDVWHEGNLTPPNQTLNTTSSPTFAGVTVDTAFFGESSTFANHAYFGRSDFNNQFDYGFLQSPDGSTYMNAPLNKAVYFMNNGAIIATVENTGLNVVTGTLSVGNKTVFHSGNLTPAAIGAAAATSGEFTATWSGGTFIVKWKKLDNEVILKFPEIGSITPKSQITFSGMLDTLRPVSDFRTIASCRNSTGFGTSCILIIPNNTGSSVGFGSDTTFMYVTKQSILYSLD